MNKSAKIVLYIFLALFAVGIGVGFFCYDFETYEYVDLSSYQEENDSVSMRNLHIDAEIFQDNVVKVTETFEMTFNRIGLSEVVRYVPYACKTYRVDNGKAKESVLMAKITDISGTGDGVDDCLLYEDEIEGYITIGLKSYTYIPAGETRSYTISYTYDMGKDRNKGYDDVYYNVVGISSMLTINNVSFSITLPTDVSETKSIDIYTGEFGSTETIEFNQSGNLITGSCEKLAPLEGITLRAVYDDGFLKYENVVSAPAIIAVVLSIIILTLALAGFICFKQGHKVLVPVELVVPQGLTPLKAEYFDKKNCSTKGVIASIVALANKGYLKINEKAGQEIELIKEKEMLDSEDYSLRALYKALFRNNDKILISELEKDYGFADAQVAITLSEKAKAENLLYDKGANGRLSKVRTILSVLMLALGVMIISTITSYIGFFGNAVTFRTIIILGLVIGMILAMYVGDKALITEIVITAFASVLMLYFYLCGGFVYFDSCYLILISIIVAGSCLSLMGGEGKYSKQGALQKGRALGFKNFIKMCEVDQIKAFALENPTYYFDVLPYAYVFGLSKVWIEKFEGIEILPPTWATADGGTITDVVIFNSMFNRFSDTTYLASQRVQAARTRSMMSSSSSGGFSSGGSSSGGGGFSGGGGGGGGFGAR